MSFRERQENFARLEAHRVRWLCVAIIVIALAIRLFHFIAIRQTAFVSIPLVFDESDMYGYVRWADSILNGDWLGRHTYHLYNEWMLGIASPNTWNRWWGGEHIFHQAPFYAYFLAILLRVSDHSIGLVLLAQLILGAVQPLVIFLVARHFFDVRVGLLAGLLCAVYGPFVFHQGTILRDWIPPILEPLALLTYAKARDLGRPARWIAAGTTQGLCVLVKPTILSFSALSILLILFEQRKSWRSSILAISCLAAGALIVMAPLIARNWKVGAPLFAVENRAAESIVFGLAADSFPIGFSQTPSMAGIMQRSNGQLLKVVYETLATYQDNWSFFVAHETQKLRGLLDPLEVPNNVSFGYGQGISPILNATLTYGVVEVLGLAGMAVSLRMWRQRAPLVVYSFVAFGNFMLTIILARFRLVLVPILMIYGAAGIMWCTDRLRSGHPGQALKYIGAVSIVALLVYGWAPLRSVRDSALIAIHPPEYRLSAKIYASRGQYKKALMEMDRLIARAEGHPNALEVVRLARAERSRYVREWSTRLGGGTKPAEEAFSQPNPDRAVSGGSR